MVQRNDDSRGSEGLSPRIRLLPLLGLLALVPVLAPAARADDWDDPRRDALEDEVSRAEAEARVARNGTTLVQEENSLLTLRHGNVQIVADLARVDLSLEIENTSPNRTLEWSRQFALDPKAEVIGATLIRQDQEPIVAQTLTLADARRIYGEVVTPTPRTPTRTRGPKKDPLRVERVNEGQLTVVVWPVEPGETVRVVLEFVTPLRGRGTDRTYVDVVRFSGETQRTEPAGPVTAPDFAARPSRRFAEMEARWLVAPGSLTLAGDPTGMRLTAQAGGHLHFAATDDRGEDARGRSRALAPSVPFRRSAQASDEALAVRGGGLGTHVAAWRFDPAAFLRAQGLDDVAGAQLRILRRAGASRIAPWVFQSSDEPVPVTARVLPGVKSIRYAVEVIDAAGRPVGTYEQEQQISRERLDEELEGAITGWHRAALARRVLAWGAANDKSDEALEFAVDVGVLVPQTAALAIPAAEQRVLRRRSRRQFRHDGAPLGAQEREADFKAPPSGSARP